jgi:anti-anti-sigma factor
VIEPLARLEVEQPDGLPEGHVRVALTGEIDLSNARDLGTSIDEVVDRASALTIDLTGVDYMDSQFMRVLDRLASRHARGELSVTLVAPAAGIAAGLLRLTGVDRLVPVVERAGPSAAARD